jgi:transcription-repair coupling factor (superfamily II helicase)
MAQSSLIPKIETLSGVPEGLDALILGKLAAVLGSDPQHLSASGGAGLTPAKIPAPLEQPVLMHIARDDRRLESLASSLAFFAPHVRVVTIPAWDCVPYDRVSPDAEIVAKRLASLAVLATSRRREPTIVVTTVNAALQRVPAREFLRKSLKALAAGQNVNMNQLIRRLEQAGFRRTGTVMEHGEYAVRGGILDLFPPGRIQPLRLDFFGDTIEQMRAFDPQTQRTAKAVDKLVLIPTSELAFGPDAESLFRKRYVEMFGAVTSTDPLYEAISAGTRYAGMEHWLPLFHTALETLFDYVPGATVTLDHLVEDAVSRRFEQIDDHFSARVDALESDTFGAPPYKPLSPSALYMSRIDWRSALVAHPLRQFSAFEAAGSTTTGTSLGGRIGRTFAAERAEDGRSVFDAVAAHIKDQQKRGRRVLVAAWSKGARERLGTLLKDHGLDRLQPVETWKEAEELDPAAVGLAVLGLETGFETPDLAVIGEQDILGDRLVRPRRKARKATDVLTEATSLSVGDLVVHSDHGIGRFKGLQTITALGAPHDCLELQYHGGDKLFLPVENIELLSRYGSDETDTQLDRLGGVAWQSRKARLKKRLREIANELIKVAALRQLKSAPVLAPPEGSFQEFNALFPHEETEDQQSSIDAVVADLQSGKPMDRLVCGDVGFGKTEVALRAAFVAVMAGKQVAVVVPTTLLARQHFRTFETRFKGYPVKVRQASRLVAPKELAETKAGLKAGDIDIVIGTHALLGKSMGFHDLGLLIIDEEQHFGVTHKERLKQMRDDVHVLTLTATPIPRTLQLALSGVRELSLIQTPPVDRLAVRTFIAPFDPVILREALLRERFRGGQTFYVCPRISDMDEIADFLRDSLPELKVAKAHGQLAPTELEDIMTGFYEGQYDVLLSTAIVESGLDIPAANTLVVHRSDKFGLAQLYQLRGRVGRSKARAYAYFTTPPGQRLTEGAEKRLKVLHSLDTLGAGFSLASHDLDIRGGGNLLGEEQSGHIREVGFELYQSMLEETIQTLKGGDLGETEESWSPQISLGTAVLIPEAYVSDLQLRLGLYRRLSKLTSREEIDAFGAELQDRFGALPQEVADLLEIVEIKALCRRAGIAQVDAGPKGATIAFRHNKFSNPSGLVRFIQSEKPGTIKVGADQKLTIKADWGADADRRLKGARGLVRKLAELAGEAAAKAA